MKAQSTPMVGRPMVETGGPAWKGQGEAEVRNILYIYIYIDHAAVKLAESPGAIMSRVFGIRC